MFLRLARSGLIFRHCPGVDADVAVLSRTGWGNQTSNVQPQPGITGDLTGVCGDSMGYYDDFMALHGDLMGISAD